MVGIKLSDPAVPYLPSGGILQTDLLYIVRGDGASPEVFSSHKTTVSELLADAGGSSAWALVASWTHSGDVANVDFTGLGAYSDLMILQRLVVCGTSGRVFYRVSSNNGLTFLAAAGDYQAIAVTGVETAATGMTLHGTDSTAARSGVSYIPGWDLAQPKPVQVGRSDFAAVVIPGATALNALRAIPTNGGNLTAGSIYIFGR